VLSVLGDAGAAMSGGSSYYPLAAAAGRTVYDSEILKIPPGFMLGINTPFLAAGSCSMQLYWWEEPFGT
jgi:hypothetical protein